MKELIKDVIIVLAVVIAVTFFFKPVIVKRTSMLPNLQENNYLITSKQAYKLFGDPQRGDIIVFPVQTDDGKELYIKRVIGLPGDKIKISDGKLYVNGKEQDQSFTMDGYTTGEVSGYTVPDGQLYVMGDNRVYSIDSRDPSVGTVPIKNITGKVILRIWPISEFGTIKQGNT